MPQAKKVTTIVKDDQCSAQVGDNTVHMTGPEPSPTDLLTASLGGCAALTLRAILQKKRVEVNRIEVEIEAKYSQRDSSYFEEINMHFNVETAEPVEDTVLQDSLRLTEEHCPVAVTYVESVNINSDLSHTVSG